MSALPPKATLDAYRAIYSTTSSAIASTAAELQGRGPIAASHGRLKGITHGKVAPQARHVIHRKSNSQTETACKETDTAVKQ
jgi:hypothetical protein